MKIINKKISTHLLLILFLFISCNKSVKNVSDEEYKIINISLNALMAPDDISRSDDFRKEDSLRTLNKNYTFILIDTLFALNIEDKRFNQLNETFMFFPEKINKEVAKIDSSKIILSNSLTRIKKEKIYPNNNFLGKIEFSRVIFDENRDKAFIEYKIYNKTFVKVYPNKFLFLQKKDKIWKIKYGG